MTKTELNILRKDQEERLAGILCHRDNRRLTPRQRYSVSMDIRSRIKTLEAIYRELEKTNKRSK